MPAERVSMRRVREILRLKHEGGASDRQIARSLSLARSTVAVTLERVAAAGLRWPLPATLSDRVLEAMLYAGHGSQQGARRKAEPDWAYVHHELRRPGVTLMLLWEEYRQRDPTATVQPLVRALSRLGGPAVADDAPGASRRRAHVRRLCRPDRRTDRRPHRRGPAAQIFVAAMGASNYTYAEATLDPEPAGLDRRARPRACLHGRRAGAAGAGQPEGRGRPRQLVRARAQPDLSRPGDALPHRDPADTPRRPRDKAKVEVAVLVVERWILARLRNRRFFSLAELNRAIGELVADLNARPMRRLGVSRRDLFLELDHPALKELPAEPYQYAEWRARRVGL